MTKSAALLFTCALCLSTPALAQDVYLGGGLAFASGTSDQVTGGAGESDLSAGMVSLILGQRFERGSTFFGWETSADFSFGAETESPFTGTACSVSATGSYLCSQDVTLRFVGIYGASVGQGTEVFGSLGIGVMKGDFATSFLTVESAAVHGLTAGVGINQAFGNGLIGRGEVIYDKFTNSSQEAFSSEYTGTTVRLSVLRKF